MAAEHQHQHQQRCTTWIDFCKRVITEGSDLGVGLSCNMFDDLAKDCLKDEAKFLNAALENPKLNFILIPSTSGKGRVDCLHQCSVYEDDLSGSQVAIGAHGSRFGTLSPTLQPST